LSLSELDGQNSLASFVEADAGVNCTLVPSTMTISKSISIVVDSSWSLWSGIRDSESSLQALLNARVAELVEGGEKGDPDGNGRKLQAPDEPDDAEKRGDLR
jgi:hypothetical protein